VDSGALQDGEEWEASGADARRITLGIGIDKNPPLLSDDFDGAGAPASRVTVVNAHWDVQ
jgi:hypothetical protein